MGWVEGKIKISVRGSLIPSVLCPGGLAWLKRLLGISHEGAKQEEIAGSNPARGSIARVRQDTEKLLNRLWELIVNFDSTRVSVSM